jgi:hypothetical protein
MRCARAALCAAALVAPARASAQGTLVITCDTVIGGGAEVLTIRGSAARCLGAVLGTITLDAAPARLRAAVEDGETVAPTPAAPPRRELALAAAVETAVAPSPPERPRPEAGAVAPPVEIADDRAGPRASQARAPTAIAACAPRPAVPRAPPPRQA